jgi:hypothetical protein
MMKKQMTTQDIVKNSDEIKNMDISWEKMYAILHEAIKSNKYRILRSGNTLFVIKILSDTEAQLNVFNAEKSFKDYIRNIKEFGKAMEKAGYKKLSARGANVQMVNILKSAKYPTEATPIGKDKKGVDLYNIVIDMEAT